MFRVIARFNLSAIFLQYCRIKILSDCLKIVLLSLICVDTATATVYYSKQEAFDLAFGAGAVVETQSIFLTDEQITEIEKLAQAKLDSKMFSLYVGKQQGQIVGYATIETHTVRTKPETLLFVLSPTGELSRIVVLAFHEPPEYQPPDRWFAQLLNRKSQEMTLGQDVQGVSGATLSSRAAISSARKILAVYQIAIKEAR